jgi:hypothetical protein
VFLAAVVHHFDESANQELMRGNARAPKPGGIVAVWESVRQDRAGRIRQIASFLDLFFGFFSEAGAWSRAEVAAWFGSSLRSSVRHTAVDETGWPHILSRLKSLRETGASLEATRR